jgi:hypothetical protein
MPRAKVWRRDHGETNAVDLIDGTGYLLNSVPLAVGDTLLRTHLELFAYGYSFDLVPPEMFHPHQLGYRLLDATIAQGDDVSTYCPFGAFGEFFMDLRFPKYDLTTIPFGGGGRYRILNEYSTWDVKAQRKADPTHGSNMWLLYSSVSADWRIHLSWTISCLCDVTLP